MLQLRSQIKPSISVQSFPFIDSNFACAFQTRRHFNDSNYANNKQIVGILNQNLHQFKKIVYNKLYTFQDIECNSKLESKSC